MQSAMMPICASLRPRPSLAPRSELPTRLGQLPFQRLLAKPSRLSQLSGSPDAPMISYPMTGFAPPAEAAVGNWTSYSVVFREDLGWRHEPTHQRVSLRELRAALANVTGVLLRGDQWVYSREGYGQEVVYLNDVRMLLP